MIHFSFGSQIPPLNLSLAAQEILVVPASSAPVERVFSTAGDATTGKRNRLKDFNLEREIFLR